MSVTTSEITTSPARKGADPIEVERALIDASARVPVLTLYASALFWLLAQMILGLIVSVKVNWPGFLADCSWLTYGRLFPLQGNLMLYGWASLAGIGTALWVLARLCRVQLPRPTLLLGGIAFWNFALFAGTLAILSGNGRGFLYLEFPRYVFGLFFIAFILMASWGIILFVNRRPGHIYISTWYFIAALFWFPWLIGGTNVLVGTASQGVFDAVVAAWFAQNMFSLWLTALGLGSIYYFIPKIVGRPIHSYYFATVGFWTFAAFTVWMGLQRLTGGPLPAWMVTISIGATILMLIPVAMVSANYFLTMRGSFNLVYHSPTLRFTFFGAVAFTVANIMLLLGSFRTIGARTQWSWFALGQDHLFAYAFFTMVMFGAMYYIIPRLTGCEWLSATFIKLHFWGSAYGFGMSAFMLLAAGLSQGSMQFQIHQMDALNPHSDFLLSVFAALPFMRGFTIAQLLICAGQAIFAIHFLLMLLRLGRPSGLKPTLFAPIQEGTKS